MVLIELVNPNLSPEYKPGSSTKVVPRHPHQARLQGIALDVAAAIKQVRLHLDGTGHGAPSKNKGIDVVRASIAVLFGAF
jgi:hypothetical protein